MDGNPFCLLVDTCQEFGGSVFLILPDESRDLLTNLRAFRSLKSKYGIQIRPIGIGISTATRITVTSETNSLQLWNGDEMFEYTLVKIFLNVIPMKTKQKQYVQMDL